MLDRDIIPKLQKMASVFPVLVLTGPRQTGKTTLVQDLAKDLGREIMYFDLENPQDEELIASDAFNIFKNNSDKTVIIDEIQRKPELFPMLRSIVDMNRVPGRFILTGSASPAILNTSSESLAGRIGYLTLLPFNLMEIEGHGNMQHHWLVGGFPQAFLKPDAETSFLWLDQFIRSYLERDLPMLGLSVSPSLMYKFWAMLAHQQSQLWNGTSFANALGVTVPTINRYIEFLEGAYIVNLLRPFEANVKKRLVKSPKVYIRDSGVLHSLAGITTMNMLERNVLIGHSWEGYVIEQIVRRLPSGIDYYYYRTQDGSECDLVLVRSLKPIATIEIKYGFVPNPTKGHTVAVQDLGCDRNYIIIPSGMRYRNKNGIDIFGLNEFVKDELPLIVG